MGEAKRIAEAVEQERSKRIAFIREHAPIFQALSFARTFEPLSVEEAIATAESLYISIEIRAEQIATGIE